MNCYHYKIDYTKLTMLVYLLMCVAVTRTVNATLYMACHVRNMCLRWNSLLIGLNAQTRHLLTKPSISGWESVLKITSMNLAEF